MEVLYELKKSHWFPGEGEQRGGVFSASRYLFADPCCPGLGRGIRPVFFRGNGAAGIVVLDAVSCRGIRYAEPPKIRSWWRPTWWIATNWAVKIIYVVVAPGETPPAVPKDLSESFFTKRKKDVIKFEFGDSGKTVYFAVQIENEGKKGPWWPLVSALIP
jgi:hypothetical protein